MNQHGSVRSPYQPQGPFMRSRPGGSSSPYPAPGHQHASGPMRAEHLRKRPGVHAGSPASTPGAPDRSRQPPVVKRRLLSDKILPDAVRKLVPDSQAYMDLLAFERKLDQTITRKRLDIQEALKRPVKVKRKLRVFISNQFYPPKEVDGKDDAGKASWELRVEGRLLDDPLAKQHEASKHKRKFSSFFKSLVIELDKDLYGPDNHLVEWHRTNATQETDGFQVKRPGDKNVRCTMLFMLNYLPPQYKLDGRLARLLGIHTQTRPVIIQALWQYIKSHKLQDEHEREFINCDGYLGPILGERRIRFADIPRLLGPLLHPPDPIVIHHVISVDPADAKKQSCYDIEVEVDDTLKTQMSSFLLSSSSQQEIAELERKITDTVSSVQQHRIQREFYMGFSDNPQEFIGDWLESQCRDLKTMTDVMGSKEEERHADHYFAHWSQEAVTRYFYTKVQQRRLELEQVLKSANV
ncbi:SWI/SNF-related matrix-associated actin-dependent regulator of chromatin subfamily D member 1-like [Styela clava]